MADTKDTAKADSSAKKSSPLVPIGIGCLVLLVLLGVGGSLVFRFFAKQIGKGMVEKAIESKTGVKTNIQDLEKGKMTFTDSKTGNTVSIGSDTIPSAFPKDMPVYPKAKVAGSVSGSSDSKDGNLVTLTTNDSMDTVVSFYKKELAANGWETSQSYTAEKLQTWVVKKGTWEGTVSVSGENNQTTIVITLGEKSQ